MGLDMVFGRLTLCLYSMGWEDWVKLLPRALDVPRYLCHCVSALKPRAEGADWCGVSPGW